ncbi:hypothetical protein HKCCA1065_06955 [Rhodobacterales bacterium HKCCA1065]|nr:hypothetical protein [Rhodobacterales bacterium HKCCA1065]
MGPLWLSIRLPVAGIAQLLEFFETLNKPHCSIGTAVSNLTLSAERLGAA